MATTQAITIEIKAKADQAQRELKATENAVDKLSSTLKTAFAAGAIVAGVTKLVGYLKEAGKAAAEAEVGVAKLSAALLITGNATDGALENLQDFAAQMMELTVIDDDAAIGILQMGINMGLTTEEAKKATQQAIALSRAYGIDLNTAMLGVVNTMEGNQSTLSRYIPALKGIEDATERLAVLTKVSGEAWAVATGEVNTAYGAQQQLKNSIGELNEAIGAQVNEQLTPWRIAIKGVADELTAILTSAQTAVEASRAFESGTATAAQSALELQRQIDGMGAAMQRMKELGQGGATAALEQQLEILKKQQEYYQGIADREARALARKTENLSIGEQQEAQRIKDRDLAAEALKLENQRLAAMEEMAALAAADALKTLEYEAAKKQAVQDRANAEFETLVLIKQTAIENEEAIAASERARHDEKMAMIQTELAVFSGYAESIGQMFNNLIQIQMSGDEELSDRKKKNIIALFKMQKAANIAQITIDTAAAIIRLYKDLPLWAAIPATALVAGVGATQIGLAAAAQPPVMLAEGGIVMPRPGGTSAILGEAGQPEAVIPLDRMGGFGNITVNVYGSVGSQEDVAVWVYEGISRARQMGKVA